MDTQSTYPSPRSIAASILAQSDVVRQRELFRQCPEHLRALVREHVRSSQALAEAKRKPKPQSTQTNPITPPQYTPVPRLSDLPRSAPEVARGHLQSLRSALAQGRSHA